MQRDGDGVRQGRRWFCTGLLAQVALLGPLAACGALPGPGAGAGAGARNGVGAGKAALLLPLTGANATIGKNMANAASLAVLGRDAAAQPPVFDTGDTAEGAAAAAVAALARGARLLMGPLRADQTPAVLAVAGQVPVVTFSNDETMADAGAFVMGVTPAQSVSAMFSYARAQGLSRIAVEFAREPDAQLGYFAGFITMGMVLSLPLIAIGIWLLLRSRL